MTFCMDHFQHRKHHTTKKMQVRQCVCEHVRASPFTIKLTGPNFI